MSEKFEFERIFSPDGASSEPKARPRRLYRAGEVDAIKAEAFKAGERSSLVQAEEAANRQLRILADQMEHILNTLSAELDLIRDDATRLAATIARKFVGHMIETAPELYLERCIEECLEVARREPALAIAVPANAAPQLKQRVARLAEQHGLASHLKIEDSAAIRGVKSRIDWRSGGAEISLQDSLDRIDAIIADHIASLAAERRQAQPAQA